MGWGDTLIVALGSAAGALLRVAAGSAYAAVGLGSTPLDTLTVNILGSLAIGALTAWPLLHRRPAMRLLLATGVCGGFTTFSLFGVETLAYLQASDAVTAALYAGGTVVTCITAAAIGQAGATRWFQRRGSGPA
ncbi:MAG: CrcB family protein [Ectothiorhodospiraceae bacterium]